MAKKGCRRKKSPITKLFAKGHIALYSLFVPKNRRQKRLKTPVFPKKLVYFKGENKVSYPAIFIKEIQKLHREGMTQKEIAKILNCSLFTVKKAIKEDPEYEKIKQRKKEKSLENHKLAKFKFKKIEKEKQEEEERLWWGMMEQQEIHARISSKKRKITNAQLVEFSLSQYIEIKGKLRYINPSQKPADLPKTYDPHKIILSQFKEYKDKIESEKWTSNTEKETLSRVEKENKKETEH